MNATENIIIYRWLAAGLFVLGISHVITYWFYQPDDAFIYLVYIKNLISGNGLTFNGEVVEGFSSVSWTFLSALLAWPGLDPLQVAKALGAGSYLAIAILLLFIQRKLTTQNSHWQKAGLLLMYFSFPLLALWAPAAMEGVLYALLITASCYVYFLASDSTSLRLYGFAGLLFGLLALTRPEGAAFIGAIFVYEASRIALKKPSNWKGVLLTLSIFAGIILMLLLWRDTRYDELLPTTVSAKTGNLQQQIKHGIHYVSRFTFEYFYLVIPYLLASLLLIVRGGPTGWWAWLSLIFVGGYCAFNVMVGGDWMIGYRFIMPITPLMICILALALPRLKYGSVTLTLGFAFYSFWLSSLLHTVAATERLATEGDIIMGKHIAAMNLPANSKIAVVDAGAIPYFAGLPTIDMLGLNNKHISKIPGGFMAKWDNDYVLTEKPKIIQLHAHIDPISKETVPSEDFGGTLKLFYTAEFQKWYRLDDTSTVPHLFIRRTTPAAHTFMDTFYEAELKTHYDKANSKLTIDLQKTGDGAWFAQTENRIQGGVLYVRVRSLADNGDIQFERYLPLTQPMKKMDAVHFDIDLPKLKRKLLSICPILVGVAEFSQCNVIREVNEAITGSVSFNDLRLIYTGWSTPEATHIWSLGGHSSIGFTLENAERLDGKLLLQVASFGSQRVNIALNKIPIFTGRLNGAQSININQAPYIEGDNLLEIATPDASSPGGSDPRVLGLALERLAVE